MPHDEEETEETAEETTDRKVKRPCERDVIVEWPDPPMEFKTIETPWVDPEFPCLMVPYNNGRQLIYSIDDQQTFFEKTPPSWWVYPSTSVHLFGEEFRPDMGKVKFWLAFMFNQSHPGSDGIYIDAATWLINDLYLPESHAMDRCYQMVNLGGQPPGVMIANVYQANSEETFNKYLAAFQEGGFSGALVRPLDHMIGEPEYAVFTPL